MEIDQSFYDDLYDVDVSKDTPNENSDAVKFSAPHMVPSSTGNLLRDQCLPLFSGDENTISFVEWWQRFSALAQAYDWTVEEQAKKQPGLVARRAFQIVSKLLVDHLLYWPLKKSKLFDRLHKKSFGVSPEKAFATLWSKNF